MANSSSINRYFKFVKASFFAAMLMGLTVGQIIEIKRERARVEAARLFDPNYCEEKFPAPWRTADKALQADLHHLLVDFGAPACESVEYRPSNCRKDVYLAQCWSESDRTGTFKQYRVDLEHLEEIFSVFPDPT